MPHTFVPYTPGFSGSSDLVVLKVIKQVTREIGAVLFSTTERPVTPENFSFKFLPSDHPLDELGRDFRIIIIHPLPNADKDALADSLSAAISGAIDAMSSRLPNPRMRFSVSMLLGPMGFQAKEVILHNAK